MKQDVLESRMDLTNHASKISQSKLMRGSTVDKYPVILDNGRTIVFISDKSRESEVKVKYEKQLIQKGDPFSEI